MATVSFPHLTATGHPSLDMAGPTGLKPWAPWVTREPWFPANGGSSWSDVYRTWFGDGDRPAVNFNLMGASIPAWDEKIRQCYEPLWREAAEGGLMDWESTPKGRIAKMILLDQLPRHIFRGRKEAFQSDDLAVRLADTIAADIAHGAPLHIEDAFMIAWPWVHQESLGSTYRAVWWHSSLAEAARGTPYHFRALLNRYGAERHVRVIQRFGRYPHRNVALGRASLPGELEHLKYRADLWETQQSKACGTLAYRLRAPAFFVWMGMHMLGSRDGDALVSFLRGCLRG